MIQSFWHKGLKWLSDNGEAKGICADQLEKSKTFCSFFLVPASLKTWIFPASSAPPQRRDERQTGVCDLPL
jgi:hypothetical protein